MQKLAFRAMGSEMRVLLDGVEPPTGNPLAAVPDWFALWEAVLSRFQPSSELRRLNARAGRVVRVSRTLWDVLQAALVAARRTGGLVTPTGAAALEAAGYTNSFATGWVLTGSGRSDAEPIPRWQAIRCRPRARTVRVPAGVRLDFGGIAKGWAADRTAHALVAMGPVLVDAGGDIRVSGPCADRSSWPIGVADPHNPDRDLALLALRHGAIATSGRDYRRWQQGGIWQHHILDPRTGRPAVTDVLTATVIAPTAVHAEAAAKAVLILGSRAGTAWLDRHPTLAGLIVLDDGQVCRSRRLLNYYWS